MRYVAFSDANNNVEVVASAVGVTVTRVAPVAETSASRYSFSIPAGVVLVSAKVYHQQPASTAAIGRTIIMDMGTADMGNSTDANRWFPNIQCMNAVSGANGVHTPTLVAANKDEVSIVMSLVSAQQYIIKMAY